MPDENLVLWLDLETDGTPEQHIIEVGCILTDQTSAFNEIARHDWIVSPPWKPHFDPRDPNRVPLGMQSVVREMHTASGLWDDVMDAVYGRMSTAQLVGEWLNDHGATTTHIPLAGSGVAHFDSRILAQHMPDLRERLTYYALDIGAVRRFVHGVKGLPWYGAADAKPHRALADAAIHLEEARWFLRNVALELTDEQITRFTRLAAAKARFAMNAELPMATIEKLDLDGIMGTAIIDTMLAMNLPDFIDRWEREAAT